MTTTTPATPVEKKRVGRPPVYTGLKLTFIQAVMLAVNAKFPNQGIKKVQQLLCNHGAVRKSYERQFGISLASIAKDVGTEVPKCKISGVTLVKIGQQMGTQITLKRGRPKKEVAAAS